MGLKGAKKLLGAVSENFFLLTQSVKSYHHGIKPCSGYREQ